MAVTAVAQKLNATWSTISSMPAQRQLGHNGGNGRYNGYFLMAGGLSDASTTYVSTTYKSYGFNWTVDASIVTVRGLMHGCPFNNFYYLAGGVTASGGNASDGAQKYNGSSWTAYSTVSASLSGSGGTIPALETKAYFIAGLTALGGQSCDFARSVSTADSSTSISASGFQANSHVSTAIQSKLYKMTGMTDGADPGSNATSNRGYNDASWSSETAFPSNLSIMSCGSNNNEGYLMGGQNTSGSSVSGVQIFNTTTFTAGAALALSVIGSQGGRS